MCARGECKPAGVCGNGLCESGEDASCASDCAAVCGNRVCENGESTACPEDCCVCGDHNCGAGELATCPQDCGICIPSGRLCLGDLLRVCNANGTAYDDIDCRAFDQKCAVGTCLEPDLCGNGACETGEDATSCGSDCTTVCGDSQCDPGETFTSCSTDCQPACGNGSCEGNEDFAGCPLDCLATCGNGACNGGEDRETCPRDCGFCGNHVCEDGAESGSLFPPEPLTTCLPDCVSSACQEDGDCDDGISCTVGDCDNGTCRYEASDALCGANAKCIKFSGCCEDADHDGFASATCGGSDCDDDAPLVYPGAFDPCGGGDRNCNFPHRPPRKPAKKITATPSFKTALEVIFDGEHFWPPGTACPRPIKSSSTRSSVRTATSSAPSARSPTRRPTATIRRWPGTPTTNSSRSLSRRTVARSKVTRRLSASSSTAPAPQRPRLWTCVGLPTTPMGTSTWCGRAGTSSSAPTAAISVMAGSMPRAHSPGGMSPRAPTCRNRGVGSPLPRTSWSSAIRSSASSRPALRPRRRRSRGSRR